MLRGSDADIWLVGPCSQEVTGSKLPSQTEILAVFMHHHKIFKKTTKESAALVAEKNYFVLRKSKIRLRTIIVSLPAILLVLLVYTRKTCICVFWFRVGEVYYHLI